jgi:hypothetical protein
VSLKEAQEPRKKKIMFCEGHVSLKEPLKKCKQFSYFAYFFERTSEKFRAIFRLVGHQVFCDFFITT